RFVQATRLGHHLLAEWGTDQTLVLGADFNAYLGQREPMFRELNRAGLQRVAHEGPSRHTFHAPGLRLPLDHVLIRAPSGTITNMRVLRLDETPDDKRRDIFGSDHHPLLARIEFAPPNRRITR